MPRLLLLCVAAAIVACGSGGTGPDPGPGPAREYRMGFSGFPPRPDFEVAVQALERWTPRADVAIVHEELPWTELLAGVAPDSILRRDKDGLIQYYRGKGLALVFIADATDGLSRGEDPPQLRALGRSFTEPAVQHHYRAWIRAFVSRYQPEHVGLLAETNLIRLAAPPALYQAAVAAANQAAAELRAGPARPRLFVSVQVEVAWGRFTSQPFQGIEQDFADFPFLELLGLSSYPYFVWSDPADLPLDYYARLLGGRALPVMIVEGGWASESAAGFTSTPARQAAYFRRQARLLEPVDALAWIQLAPTDLQVSSFPAHLQAAIRPFSRLGVLDTALAAKPALVVWDSLFALPRR